MHAKKILAVFRQHDYGDPSKGPSYTYHYHYGTLQRLFAPCRMFDFGPYVNANQIDKLQVDLLSAVKEFQPDAIFFHIYRDEFKYETLDRLKEQTCTVNWFSDDQWRFEELSSKFCHHFSHIITTDPYALPKYEKAGYEHAILTQWATLDSRPEFAQAPSSYRYDVSFVGLENPFRRWMIRELGKRDTEVVCFGTGWPRGRLTYEEVEAVFHSSRINLNISNSRSYDIRYVLSGRAGWKDYRKTRKTREQLKGRHFEIPACGGFQLTNYVEFLEDYFWIGKEVAVYNILDDLVDKIRFYLDRENLRQEIAHAGCERARREHTYVTRFEEIFRTMGVLD
jgi:spore maturation protein CgeB